VLTTENCRVRADPQGKRQDDDGRETRAFSQPPKAVGNVSKKGVHQMTIRKM